MGKKGGFQRCSYGVKLDREEAVREVAVLGFCWKNLCAGAKKNKGGGAGERVTAKGKDEASLKKLSKARKIRGRPPCHGKRKRTGTLF